MLSLSILQKRLSALCYGVLILFQKVRVICYSATQRPIKPICSYEHIVSFLKEYNFLTMSSIPMCIRYGWETPFSLLCDSLCLFAVGVGYLRLPNSHCKQAESVKRHRR